MGKSFVLKDEAGRPGGYLVQGMREICCRAGNLTQHAQAVLLFEGGMQETHEISGGTEARWPSEGRLLSGGCVCEDGRLVLATGEEARAALKRLSLQTRRGQDQSRVIHTDSSRQNHSQEEKTPNVCAQEARQWPQRRWPPPPCWPGAVYAKGCWQERAQRIR